MIFLFLQFIYSKWRQRQLKPFKAYQELYVPPGLTFKNTTFWLHTVYEFSEQTATFALYNIKSLIFLTAVDSVYSAVRNESLYNTGTFLF